MTPTYNEGQSFTARFTFLDADHVETSPLTVRYRIDCLTSRETVRDWTTLTPAAVLDVSVVPADNAIRYTKNRQERKQIVVQSNYGTDTQAVQTQDWWIKNLQGVT